MSAGDVFHFDLKIDYASMEGELFSLKRKKEEYVYNKYSATFVSM